MRFLLISFFSIQFLKAEPWFDYDHIDLIYLKNEISYNCELPAPSFNRSPISLLKLQSYINNIRKTNLNKNCQASLERASFVLANKLSKVELILGIQTKTDDIFLQERGERFYKNTNIYFSRSEVINKFAYKLNIKKFKNEMYFDD